MPSLSSRHHKASALIDVESTRDETMRQQPREALAVGGIVAELGDEAKVAMDIAVGCWVGPRR